MTLCLKLSLQLVRGELTVFAACEKQSTGTACKHCQQWVTGNFLKMLLPIGRNRQTKQTPWKIPFQQAKEELWPFSHLKINRSPVFLMISLFCSGFFLLVCLEVVWCWDLFVCFKNTFIRTKNQPLEYRCSFL